MFDSLRAEKHFWHFRMKDLFFCFLGLFLLVSNSQAELSPEPFRDAIVTNLQHTLPPPHSVSLTSAVVDSDCADPLTCWLEELTFQIPDTCFEVLHVECCITEFICSGIALGNIDSLYTYPTALYMSFEDLGTSCAGNWKYGVLGGTLQADLTHIDVSTTADFPKEDIYATAMTFPTCDIPSIDIELSFSGGLVGAVLDLISGAVEKGLEKAVYSIVCEKAEGAIAEKVTTALVDTINPAVAELVATVPSLPVPAESLPLPEEGVYVDYPSSLPGLLGQLEQQLGDDYLNKLVDYLTGDTGTVTLDLQDLTVEKEILDPTSGPLANITLVLHSLQLRGLDTFHDISVLTASPPTSPVYSPYSISSALSLHTMKATLDMTLDVELDQQAVSGGSLVERFAVELDLSEITLGAELFMPLHLQRLGELRQVQLHCEALHCLLGTLDYFSLSSLVADMHVDLVSITPLGDVDPASLEADIDQLINDIIQVGTSGFPELVTGVIGGVVQGPLRAGLNAKLAELLTQAPASCGAHEMLPPDTPPSYIEWAQAPLLGFLDKLLNDVLGFQGVNKLVDKLTADTGKIALDLEKVVVELFNLDSFYQFALLTPATVPPSSSSLFAGGTEDEPNPYTLDSLLGLGFCKGHGRKDTCTPLGLSVTPVAPSAGSVSDSGSTTGLTTWALQEGLTHLLGDKRSAALALTSTPGSNPVEILLSNATAFLSAVTQLDQNKVAGLQLNQLTAHTGCVMSVVDRVQIEELSLSLAEAVLQKGPLVQTDILEPVQKLLDVLGGDRVLGVVNKVLQAVLDTAEEACEAGEWPDPPSRDDDDNDDDIAPVCDSPLSCLLNHLVLGPIPAEGEEACLEIAGLQFCASDLQCFNMDLEGLPSSLVDPHTLALGLTDLDITCSGSYAMRKAGEGDTEPRELYAGSTKIKMTDFSSSVNVELEPYPKSNQYPSYPDGVSLQSCEVIAGYTAEVSFQGGVLGSILDKSLGPMLSEFLEEDLNWLLCYVLAPPISRVLTKIVKDKVDPVLWSLMDVAAAPILPVQESGMVAWNTSVLAKVYDLLEVLKAQQGHGVPTGFGDVLSCVVGEAEAEEGGSGVSVSSAALWQLLTDPAARTATPVATATAAADVTFPGITLDIGTVLPLPLSDGTTGSFTIETLTVSGLKTLHDLALLKPSETSSVTLTTGLSLSSLDLQLAVLVQLDDTADTTHTDGFGVYTQEVILDLKLLDTTLELDLVVALEEAVLGALYLDQVLDMGCLMSSLADLRVSSLLLDMAVDNLSLQQVRRGDAGVLEKDTVLAVDNAIAVLVEGYPEMLTAVLMGVFQGPVKDGFNVKLGEAVQGWQASHPCGAHTDHHANTTAPQPVVWSENQIVVMLDKVLNDVLGAAGLNKLMSCVTNSTGEVLIHIPPTSSLLADWTIGLEGLTSFYEFALLYPVEEEPYDLGNMLGMGYCVDPEDATDYNPVNDPLNHGASCSPFALTISGDEPDGRHVAIAITLENLYLYLDLLLELNMKAVGDLQLSQLSQEGCLMSTMTEMGVYDLLLTSSDVEFYFNNGEAQVDLTSLVSSILDKLSSPDTLESINTKMEEALTVATQKCNGEYQPLDGGDGPSSNSSGGLTDWKWQLGLLLGCCFLAVAILLWIYNHYGTTSSKRKHVGDESSFEYDGEEGDYDTNSQSMYESGACLSNEWLTEKIAMLFGWTEGDFHYDALLGQEKIPAYVRILMPLALLGNIILFLNSNLAVGASVMVEVDVGDMVIKPDPVFEFGLANTVSDMWQAEVYPLSILVAFFSGGWPYMKLAAILVCWLLPTSALPLRYRDSTLVWLDILGKWSLLDTYVMVMMMVAFNFNLIVAPGIEVIVYVVPNWGFYGFLLATMMSLGLGHLVLACHRLVSEPKVPTDDLTSEALMDHTFTVEISQKSVELSSFSTDETMSSENHQLRDQLVWKPRSVRFTRVGKCFIFTLLAGTILAMVVGTFMNTFQFEFKGLTGYLMDPDDRVMPYGLVSIGDILPEASGSPKDFGIRWIQASYFAFGLGMPLAFMTALLLLWITPLTLRVQKFCVVMTEVLNAWNALDVFVVSIVAALMEIQQFASFIVGDSCDIINEVLKETMDTELEGDDKCFDVVATLKNTAVYLYLSAFLLVGLGLVVLRMYHSAVSERLTSFQHKQLADEFSCLSEDGVRPSQSCIDDDEEEEEGLGSRNTSMSGRSTLATSPQTSSSVLPNPFLASGQGQGQGQQDEQQEGYDRQRVDTVDLTNDDNDAPLLRTSKDQEGGQYRPPSLPGTSTSTTSESHSAYEKDIDHMASVLTSKSKSSSSTRPATLAEVLSNHDSEEGEGRGGGGGYGGVERGCGTRVVSFTAKAFRMMGLVTISTDEDEDEEHDQGYAVQ